MKNRRKTKITIALLLIIAMLIAGTFAYVNNEQSKRNQAESGNNIGEIALVDDYPPPAKWKKDEELKPDVYVRYLKTPVGKKPEDPVVVRVRLSEYLQIDGAKNYSTDKYVTYSNASEAENNGVEVGSFVTFNNTDDFKGSRFCKDGISLPGYTAETIDGKVYVKVADLSANEVDNIKNGIDEQHRVDGQFGRKRVISIDPAVTPMVDDDGKVTFGDKTIGGSSVANGYVPVKKDYVRYFMGKFDDGNNANYSTVEKESIISTQNSTETDDANKKSLRDYIEMNLGIITTAPTTYNFDTPAVMTVDDYNNIDIADKSKVECWVYAVDSEGNPWLYWNRALLPGQETLRPMQSVKLLKDISSGSLLYLHNFDLSYASYLDEGYKANGVEPLSSDGEWLVDPLEPLTGSAYHAKNHKPQP